MHHYVSSCMIVSTIQALHGCDLKVKTTNTAYLSLSLMLGAEDRG